MVSSGIGRRASVEFGGTGPRQLKHLSVRPHDVAMLERILALLLLAGAIAVGVHQGRVTARPVTVAVTALTVLGISNLLASWPWFVADQPETWPQTYFSALALTGLASLVIHVAPFGLAWYLARRFKVARSRHAA